MLFSRVYNWIKYKTLPPSVLFLNRLFVERDSKHRRVTSNLGLTFRNSKWSTYARVNININSKTSYLQLILKSILSLFLILSIFKFSNYYNLIPVYNYLYPLIWFLSDADLYLKVIFSSSLFCTIQLICSSAYSKLLSLVFNSDDTSEITIANSVEPLVLPKRLHKPIMYSWLTSNPRSTQVSSLFDSKPASSYTLESLELTKLLFQSTNLIIRSSESYLTLNTILKKLNSEISQASTPALTSVSATSALNFQILGLEYASTQNFSKTFREPYFNECNYWTLSSVESELVRNASSLTSISGLFYSPEISHSKLTNLMTNVTELAGLRGSVEDQISTIRWQRWLYKYNILHRAALKNTLYLTSTKKLLSSGFYGSTMASKNIWASSALQPHAGSTQLLQTLTEAVYGDFTQSSIGRNRHLTPTAGFYNSTLLGSLGFYELSYHWFIQRFYQFNTLSTNSVRLTPSLTSISQPQLGLTVPAYESAYTNFNLHVSKSFSLPTSSLVFDSYPNRGDSEVARYASRDIYLQYLEANLFNKQRVEVIQNLNTSSSAHTLTFFLPSPLR